jgi:acyl-[acyl-carrier-protein]-phospholipid O-acyltransferase/long-chain-fatty-acid--[acyl-carrier-protein] ligase
VTFLPARRLVVDPALKGKVRRQTAGLALQDIMVDAAVETAHIDQTLFSALAEARKTRDTGKPALSDPLGIKLSYRKVILGAQVLGAKLEALDLAPAGGAIGVMLPNSAGVAVTFFALQTIARLPCRGSGGDRHVAYLRRQGAPGRAGGRNREGREDRLPGGRARHHRAR